MSEMPDEHKVICKQMFFNDELLSTNESTINSIFNNAHPYVIGSFCLKNLIRLYESDKSDQNRSERKIYLLLKFLESVLEDPSKDIVSRKIDYLKVLNSAIEYDILDQNYQLTSKRCSKPKFASIMIQLYDRQYFISHITNKKAKRRDVIKFCKARFDLDLTNYFYRKSMAKSARRTSVLPIIEIIEFERARK